MAKDNDAHTPQLHRRDPQGETTFVRRATYRQRRLRDASRLLPFAGFAAIMLSFQIPISQNLAGHLTYLLMIWAGLVVTAFLLSIALDRTRQSEE